MDGDARASAASHLDGILDAHKASLRAHAEATEGVTLRDNAGITDAHSADTLSMDDAPAKAKTKPTAGIDDVYTTPSATPLPVGVPIPDRVAVLLCQPAPTGDKGTLDVLCFRSDTGEVSIVEHEGHDESKHEDVACRLIDGIVAKPRALRGAIHDQRQSSSCRRALPMSKCSAFATMLTSLPVKRPGGEWIWIPAGQLETHVANPVMQRVVLDALAAFARSKGYNEQQWPRQHKRRARPQLGSAAECGSKHAQLGSNRRKQRRTSARLVRQPMQRCTSQRQPGWNLPPVLESPVLESQELPAQLGRGKVKDGCHAVRSQVAVTPLHLRPFNLPSEVSLWHQQIDRITIDETPSIRLAAVSIHPSPFSPSTSPVTSGIAPQLEALTVAAVAELNPLRDAPAFAEQSNERLLEQVVQAAKNRARSRGAAIPTPRDVADAARELDRRSTPRKSPADQLPQHYDEIVTALTAISAKVEAAVLEGVAPPRVLFAGEQSGVGAKLFKMAGADVATCSLEPTETPWIPHFQGDMHFVLDLGWDLILGFPPCTFLSNASISALYSEPGRYDLMVRSAADFRRV